jgi:hypothetical protein
VQKNGLTVDCVVANKISKSVKPVSPTGQIGMGSIGSRSVRPVVKTDQTSVCVDSCPCILLCENSCHTHHVYYFTIVLHPTN